MIQTHFAPHPALLEYIDSIFVLHFNFTAAGSPSSIYPFVPTPNRLL